METCAVALQERRTAWIMTAVRAINPPSPSVCLTYAISTVLIIFGHSSTVTMKLCFAILILNIIFLISYFNALTKERARRKGPDISRDTITPLENNKTFVISRDTITPLENNKTFIIAAYYDGRESSQVRVLTIIKKEDVKELYCWFYCMNDPGYVSVKATIEIYYHWFGFSYGPADVVCPEPLNCSSQHISIHWSNIRNTNNVPVFEIKNRNPQPISANFTVCISTMFGNQDTILQFIQAIEMYRLLGAQKVVIYKNGCSKAMGRVLDFYVSEGFLEIVPWPIDTFLRTSADWHQSMNPKSQIGYYGQLSALNDCMYRNMYKSRYVTLNDVDEIILPRHSTTWDEMMEVLEKAYPDTAVYLVKNYIYPKKITAPNFQTAFPKNVPGINILQLIYYEPGIPNGFNNRKMIVNPREVIQMSVHVVLRAYKKSVYVPDNIVSLHHGRTPMQPDLPQTSLIRDTTIWKYSSSLITNVNKVLRQLNYH